MANIEGISGIFGGVKTDEPIQKCENSGIGIENAININGENTVQLNAKVIPSNANKNTEITWTSKKKAVASVN